MNIESGDLILFRVTQSANWFDRLIAYGQRLIHEAPTSADYCHVAIAAENPYEIYEARWPKIHKCPFEIAKVSRGLVVEVYRVKGKTTEQVAKVMDYCRSQLGEWYPVSAILSFGRFQFGKGPYCSQLAWRAWQQADVLLFPYEAMQPPDAIPASDKVDRIMPEWSSAGV